MIRHRSSEAQISKKIFLIWKIIWCEKTSLKGPKQYSLRKYSCLFMHTGKYSSQRPFLRVMVTVETVENPWHQTCYAWLSDMHNARVISSWCVTSKFQKKKLAKNPINGGENVRTPVDNPQERNNWSWKSEIEGSMRLRIGDERWNYCQEKLQNITTYSPNKSHVVLETSRLLE